MARSAEASPSLVSWRSGVHIENTPIWCDARRACDVCFASSADALSRARHGQLIATEDTALLLENRKEGGPIVLSSPYGRPFTIGNVRLELFPSGYAPGAASLLVQREGARIAYAGALSSAPSPLSPAVEVRPCDAVVVSGRFSSVAAFPPPGDVLSEVGNFAADAVAKDRTAVLLVTTPLEGIELAAALAAETNLEKRMAAHRSIHHAAQKLRPRHPALPPLRRFARASAADIVLWPCRSRTRLEQIDWPQPPSIALVSGLAALPGWPDRMRADAAFALSRVADRSALLDYIASTGASEVYVTDADLAAVAELGEHAGRSFHRLGGAEQMSLFG